MTGYKKSILDCGLPLVTENISDASSVAIGIWVAAGSRDETAEENGVAHLIEHMLFKGTNSRNTAAIAREIDRLGGQANACTTRETTYYYNRVRPDDLEQAVDLLCDMLQNSLFEPVEVEREKQVIMQEIAMTLDDPEELVHELKDGFSWPNIPLGRPVAGTWESVSRLDGSLIEEYMARNYNTGRIVISAAGKVEHDHLAQVINKRFKNVQQGEQRPPENVPSYSGFKLFPKKLEQVHLVMGCPFPSLKEERRYAASIFNLLLGGNMSSRLFQEIREKQGLTYSVYSYYSAFSDCGILDIYAAVAPEKVNDTIKAVGVELKKLKEAPLSIADLHDAAEALKTDIILNGESCEARMSRLARNELFFGDMRSLEEICHNIEKVTPQCVYDLANEFIQSEKMSVCLLGPLKNKDYKEIRDRFYEAGI